MTRWKFLVLLAILPLLFGASAWANKAAGYSTSGSFDGIRGDVTGKSFNALNSNCLIYGHFVTDPDSQLLLGLLKCDGGNFLSGNPDCTGGVITELNQGSSYTCFREGGYVAGNVKNLRITRNSQGSPCFQAYFEGSAVAQKCDLASATHYSLAEYTGDVCGQWSGEAKFQNVEKRNLGSGWSDLSNNNPLQVFGAPFCWTIGAFTGTGSNFTVSRP